jgi:uncharacterized membrane protein
MKVEISIVINRPVEEVFAVVTNLETGSKWSTGFLEARKTSEGPIGVGTTWRAARKVLGQRLEAEAEVTEFEPNRKHTQKSKSGPFPVEIRQTFESVEGGTRVTAVMEAEPGGFLKLAEPLLQSYTKRTVETEFADLKELMEAHAL